MHPIRRSVRFTLVALLLGVPLALLWGWLHCRDRVLTASAVGVAYMATPSVAAWLACRWDGEDLADRVPLGRVTPRWLWACTIPGAIVLLTLGITPALPGVALDGSMSGVLDLVPTEQRALLQDELAQLPSPWVMVPAALVGAILAGTTVNGIAALGEEAGWRGWMHTELAPIGFWPRVAMTGSLWGLWHAPLIVQGYNYPEHPVLGVAMMMAMCVGLSGPLAWVREHTGGVLPAAIFHGTFNGAAQLPLLYSVGGSDLLVGMTGLAGLTALFFVNGGMALAGVGRRAGLQGR